jgi:hypothetical protein
MCPFSKEFFSNLLGDGASLDVAESLELPKLEAFATAHGLTGLRLRVPSSQSCQLAVFDVGGRVVRKISGSPASEGVRDVVWDGLNDTGTRMPRGVYLYVLNAGPVERRGRFVLIR